MNVTRDDVEAALWRAGICRSIAMDELLTLIDDYADTWMREMKKRAVGSPTRGRLVGDSARRKNGNGINATHARASADTLNSASDKTCKSCGETKSVLEFYQNKRNSDGRQTICKACDYSRRANRRAELNVTRRSVAFGLARRSD